MLIGPSSPKVSAGAKRGPRGIGFTRSSPGDQNIGPRLRFLSVRRIQEGDNFSTDERIIGFLPAGAAAIHNAADADRAVIVGAASRLKTVVQMVVAAPAEQHGSPAERFCLGRDFRQL